MGKGRNCHGQHTPAKKSVFNLSPGLLPSGFFALLGLSRTRFLWILGRALSRLLSGGYRPARRLEGLWLASP